MIQPYPSFPALRRQATTLPMCDADGVRKWSEVKYNEVKWSEAKWSEVKWHEVQGSEVKPSEVQDRFDRLGGLDRLDR